MRQIFNKENSIDVALLNMRSWKHGFSGSHTLYLSAIIPSILGQVISKLDEKAGKKVAFETLKSELLHFKEIAKSFA